jgi:hypothetical protein
MAPTDMSANGTYLLANTHGRPAQHGPHIGEVTAYISKTVNGESVPVRVTAEQAQKLAWLGDPEPVPEGWQTVPITYTGTDDLLRQIQQRITRNTDRTDSRLEGVTQELRDLRRALDTLTRPKSTLRQRLYWWARRQWARLRTR